ncbi:helix-turn-helix domain-containing protein [Jannaschia sp. R86511]|uniref:TetR/AcrR family transcriptional regulator n=1 Tax=Jannaschia sp. R86511 TaxID=3093853 RepID=UPI0036D27071
MTSARRPGNRAGLDRETVLAAARRLLDQGGADALTMRALARDLAVAPNALYSHVADKDALLDALLDDVLAGVTAARPGAARPVSELRRLMLSTYEVLLAHPHLVPLLVTRRGARGPHAARLGRETDDLLRRAGVAEPDVVPARTVLVVHTIGMAAFSAGPTDAVALTTGQASARTFADSLRWLLVGTTGVEP